MKDISKFKHNKRLLSKIYTIRPDILYNKRSHVVIVEIDEFQHKCYSNEKELIRMDNICMILCKPVVFIRFNPDSYKINSQKINTTFNDRLTTLVERIRYHLTNIPNNNKIIEKMYFDNLKSKE